MTTSTKRPGALTLVACLLFVTAVCASEDGKAMFKFNRKLTETDVDKRDWKCQGVPTNPQNNAMQQFSNLCLLVPGNRKCPGNCATGYTGKPFAQCRLGRWVFSGKCTQGGGQGKSCSKMPGDPKKGAFPEGCVGTASGKTCEAICDDGYTGAPIATCTNGKWAIDGTCEPDNPPATQCIAADYDFTLAKDRLAWEDCCAALAEQDVANEDCDNPPGCAGDPADVADGTWDGCDGTAHNEACTSFTCSDGFDSTDTPVSALCYIDTWLDPVGECVPM